MCVKLKLLMMRNKNLFGLILISVFVLALSSCDDDPDVVVVVKSTDLKVMVKKNNASTPFTGTATVTLFLSEDSLNKGFIYKDATTNSSGEVIFKGLKAQKYWVKGVGTVGSWEYTGSKTVTVVEDIETSINLILVQGWGDLKVIVYKENTGGQPIGDATVSLYESMADKNNNNPISTATTAASSGGIVLATFYTLEPLHYFHVKAEFDFQSENYSGADSVRVPLGAKISIHLACIK